MKVRYLWSIVAALPMTGIAAGSSGVSTITNITIDTWGGFAAISGASTWSNPDGCAASAVVVLPFSNQYYKEVLAAVMTASASGKSISFWVSGCAWTPWGGAQPVISSVTLN